MKPVVSSLVALVISIAPLTAMAKQPAHHAKTAHVQKKADKHEVASDKSEKNEKVITRVKAGKKDAPQAKTAVHHASGTDMSGAGHHEPGAKDTHGGALVAASMTTKIVDSKKHEVKTEKHEIKAKATSVGADKKAMPQLPAPNAKKSAKEGVKKGAEKKAEPKSETASSDDGETTRDEELAELVARIRGVHSEAPAKSADAIEPVKGSVHPKHVSHQTPVAPAKPCMKEPVEIVRGPEVERFELTKCDGSIAPAALERFSVLIRPGGAARPTMPAADLAKKTGPEIAPGIRRVDARLLERVQQVAEHFGKTGGGIAKFSVISGVRPASIGSMHSTGRAMDFRLEGVKNEEIVAFCKTLNDTGCGYYPNSSFVHMDVRDNGTGHTAWIDASGPGETPRYVTQWPPPAEKHSVLERSSATEPALPGLKGLEEEGEAILRANRPQDDSEVPVPVDDHPAVPAGSDN